MSKSKYPEMMGFDLIERRDGVYARNANQIKSKQRAIVDFKSPRKSNLPVINVESKSGRKTSMLLDTSSRKSWISYEASTEYDVIPVGPDPYRYAPNHLSDSTAGILTCVPYMRINKTIMTSALFYLYGDKATLWPIARSYRKPKIDMVMGCGMMKAFSFIRIDYKNRAVALVPDKHYPSDTNSNILASAPIVWKNGAIAVKALLDGKQQLVFIDTGANYELARPNGKMDPCNNLFIGDLAISDPAVTDSRQLRIESRELPSIGSKLLSKYILVIDMVKQEIHFVRPQV